MELVMQTEEAELLKQILTNYLSDLRMEISNTDSYDLREYLKSHEATIRALLVRLQQVPV